MSSEPSPYLKTITHLRVYEEIMLYGNFPAISEEDQAQVGTFLQCEYEDEQLDYPFEVPEFDEAAALWGARILYTAAQFLLYRQNSAQDLPNLFREFPGQITPGAILSADLSLRFLPDILIQLKVIDPEDALIEILENLLHDWHYSAISYSLNHEGLSFQNLEQSRCLMQLYLNRIVDKRNLKLAHHPFFAPRIGSDLGIYASQLWTDFIKPELPPYDWN
ncbi:hypothetical protein [Desertivirga arenae]|uniref:hypothetical protein n=1 Tax=Desertivirga arenae TaxID=2810309 RepID=UPI001A968432|nr:hypothetical protein [Pedobacter sp. SYSU D00823]